MTNSIHTTQGHTTQGHSTQGHSTQGHTRHLAAIYGLMHALVDWCTVTAIFRASGVSDSDTFGPFELVLGYDLLAFGLQLPLGMVVDRLRVVRAALISGLILTFGGLLLIEHAPVATMLVAGIGNALFHLGAGAFVLVAAQGRAAPAGVFVAPGALGLGLGMWMGRDADLAIWPLVALLAIALAVALRLRNPRTDGSEQPARPVGSGTQARLTLWWSVLGLLVASIMVRSFVGFAGGRGCPPGLLLAFGIPIAGFVGKLVGGLISDRIGWLETSVGALLLSAPILAFAGHTPAGLLPGLVVFQVTMPVTLTAAYLLFPRSPATAFGLPCLGLIVGSLPTFFDEPDQVYSQPLFLGLILASAAACYGALRWLGVGRAYRGLDERPGVSPLASSRPFV